MIGLMALFPEDLDTVGNHQWVPVLFSYGQPNVYRPAPLLVDTAGRWRHVQAQGRCLGPVDGPAARGSDRQRDILGQGRDSTRWRRRYRRWVGGVATRPALIRISAAALAGQGVLGTRWRCRRWTGPIGRQVLSLQRVGSLGVSLPDEEAGRGRRDGRGRVLAAEVVIPAKRMTGI